MRCTCIGQSYHSAESSGIADVTNVEDKVNLVYLRFDHPRGVEGLRLDILHYKEALIFLTTSHV